MGEHLGRVIGAVADVHHHLRHVHRPALGEDPGAEDARASEAHRFDQRQLEVVAGHRLVDRQQPQRAAVVLAQERGDLVVGQLVGRRRDREEAVEALVQRPGWDEHRAAEGPQERRRPDDLERLVRKADEVALADEVLDVPMLLAAEVEQLGGLRVVLPDRIEDRRVMASGSSGIGSSPIQVGHNSRARRAISARTSSYVAAARRSSSSGEIVAFSAWSNLRWYSSRPRRKSPCARGRRSSRSQSTNSSTSPAAFVAVDSTRVRSMESSSSAAIEAAVRHRSATPGIVAIAFSTWNVATSRPRPELQVRPRRVEDVSDPLHATGSARQSSLQRGELSTEEAEEPAAEDVGVADRRPRQLVELLLLEAQLVDDAEQDPPVDLLLGAEALLGLEVPRELLRASPGEPSCPHRSGPASDRRARGCRHRWRAPGSGGRSG